MKKFKLKKIIAVVLTAVSVSTLHILNADAAWVKDSNGWWNTEGDSWSIGWRFIANEWYYFDSQGYMKTGWILDGGKWYYLNSDGSMAKNTIIGEYKIGADGAWIDDKKQENTTVVDNNLNSQNNLTYPKNEIDIAESYIESQKYKIIKNIGYINSYSLNTDMLYDSIYSVINQQIWSVQKDNPYKYLNKQINVYKFTVENHPLEQKFNVNINVYIMICNNEIIGGYSIPNDDNDGSIYSLDGKTAEEITGLNAKQLSEKWKEKYRACK